MYYNNIINFFFKWDHVKGDFECLCKWSVKGLHENSQRVGEAWSWWWERMGVGWVWGGRAAWKGSRRWKAETEDEQALIPLGIYFPKWYIYLLLNDVFHKIILRPLYNSRVTIKWCDLLSWPLINNY